MSEVWERHYVHLKGKNIPPAATLSKALSLFEQDKGVSDENFAIDLGCGNGIDTLTLLNQGWQVLAVDKEQEALSQLMANVPTELMGSCATLLSSFEDLNNLPQTRLINATFSLPFCQPGAFGRMWDAIIKSLIPGGRFAGHFFGNDDSWSGNPDMTFLNADVLHSLFSGFAIEAFQEVNKPGKTVSGSEKHWHVFHVVAKKK